MPFYRPINLAAATLLSSALIAAPAATTSTTAVAQAQAETPAGLPTVTSGHRPGPDALYLPAPRAPQLENVAPWSAEPILISGTSAYRDGEFLYQDFLFDDHGMFATPDRNDPYGVSYNLYSPAGGTLTYPTDSKYGLNAADLVEFRVKPLADATAFRVTMNTLVDPDVTAFTVALGDTVPAAAWPAGAGVTSPAEFFLTVNSATGARLTDALGLTTTEVSVSLDLERRQYLVTVPHSVWDPGTDTVRMTIGAGLWDADTGEYIPAGPGLATATTPGGGLLPTSARLFNVGPRYDEPTPALAGFTMADTAAGTKVLAPWWRERAQSLALSQGDVSPFFANVDFAKLAAGTTDDSQIPTTGPMNRIMASRYVFGQGVAVENVCFGISAGIDVGTACQGRYVGQLQPYAIYVPDMPVPTDGYGLTLLLHALSANHNQYLASRHQSQIGDRGAGSIVITPEARGPDGFYKGIPEANTFEVWADAARHYPLNPEWVSISGYSMGSFGTYRLTARYPDLFARGFNVVGEPGTVADQLISVRNVPMMSWNAGGDELVNINTAETAHANMVAAGAPHTYWLFPAADHLTFAGNDEYQPGADFLGEHLVDRSPATIAYVVDPREDTLDVVADHAYWLSDLMVAAPDTTPTGSIEVHSHAFGLAPTEAVATPQGGGTLNGGQNGAMAYIERGIDRPTPAAAPVENKLTIVSRNIAAVTVDAERARITCSPEVEIDSDVELTITFVSCPTVAAPPATPAPAPPLPSTGGGAALAGLLVAASAVRLRRRRG